MKPTTLFHPPGLLGRALVGLAAAAWMNSAGAIMLGTYSFNDNQFGDTLLESDGGTFSAANWLNVVNADPGNPGYLTGANFDTGIANITAGTPFYTIGYGTPIVNVAGDDFGIVVARFSTDSLSVEVSTDGGGSFSAPVAVGAGSAVSTGVGKSYFYGGGGPFGATLFVHSLDLSSFGIGLGSSVDAIRVRSTTSQLDLIRVAGFGEVPAPASLLLLGTGLLGLLGVARRR